MSNDKLEVGGYCVDILRPDLGKLGIQSANDKIDSATHLG